MRFLLFLLICATAVPVDIVFLAWSTARLIVAGFGLVEAFKYSLQR